MKINDVKSWGIDIGNVLIKNVSPKTWQYYAEHNVPAETIVNHLQLLPDALVGLRFLIHQVGRENVWIISKAKPEIMRLAFEKFRIHMATGLDPDQVLFVPQRLDKIPVAKVLELEGFIDDRGEVISSLQSFVKCPIWFRPEPDESAMWIHQMNYNIRVVSSWHQLMDIF